MERSSLEDTQKNGLERYTVLLRAVKLKYIVRILVK